MSWVSFTNVDLGNILQLLAWTFIVHGLAYAAFSNPLVGELTRRFGNRLWIVSLRTAPIEHELRTGRKGQEQAPELQAVLPKLTEAEVEERLAELETARRKEPLARLVLGLLECPFCRAFWIALVLALAFESGWPALASAFGYAAVSSVLISGWLLGSRGGCGKA